MYAIIQHLTLEEKEVIMMMFAAGRSIHQIAIHLRRSDKAVKRYLSKEEVQEEVVDRREILLRKFQAIAELAADRLLAPGVMEHASPRDCATIAGIAVDKARVLFDLKSIEQAREPRVSLAMDDRTRAALQAALDKLDKHDAIDITPGSEKALISQCWPPKEDK